MKIEIPPKYATPIILNRFKHKKYEKQEINLLKKYLDPDAKVLELGACLGVTSVITNQILKNKTNHIIVEANPELINSLEKTKELNDCNFKILNCIVGNKQYDFFVYNKVVAGSAHRKDSIESGKRQVDVKTITLGTIIKQYKIRFDTIIMDIEGGELEFMNDYRKYFISDVKTVIVELHGSLMLDKNFNQECIKFLKDINFDLIDREAAVYVFKRQI